MLAQSIAALQSAGAAHILITNEYFPPSTTAYQIQLAGILNSAFTGDLLADGVHYIFADTSSLISQVAADPSKYNITNATGNACNAPSWMAAGSTGYGATCAPTTTPYPGSSFGYGDLVSADALSTYLFMDGIHLTEAGEIITADYIEQDRPERTPGVA